jgi:hypothetical protein
MNGLNWIGRIVAGSILGVFMLAPQELMAKRYLDEDFDYSSGNLYNQGDWLRHGKNDNEPIQLIEPALQYPGYRSESLGLSAKLIGSSATKSHERLQKQFDSDGVKSGVLYLSALVNVVEAPTGSVYFMALCQRGAKADNGIIDTKAGTEVARVFACVGDGPAKFRLGISKTATAEQDETEDLDPNTTYLVVVKYEFVSGSNNDIVTMWVNPEPSETEPVPQLVADMEQTDATASMGLQGVTLRQGSTNTKIAPDLLVDAIRVTDSWSEIWDGDSSVAHVMDDKTSIGADVYNLQGMLVARNLTVEQAIGTLSPGIYIRDGKKLIVK